MFLVLGQQTVFSCSVPYGQILTQSAVGLQNVLLYHTVLSLDIVLADQEIAVD